MNPKTLSRTSTPDPIYSRFPRPSLSDALNMPKELYEILQQALDAFDDHQTHRGDPPSEYLQRRFSPEPHEVVNSTTADVLRIRHLLREATFFHTRTQRRRRSGSHLHGYHVLVEHYAKQRHTRQARAAIQVTKRRSSCSRRLLEFKARITYIPGSTAQSQALSAEFYQIATLDGLLSLPPTISLSAVIRPDAEIFQLIDHGDVYGVQQLLRSGRASVRDCDSFGRTVLHIAAWNATAELWAMLISEGADLDCVTALSSSPLLLCCGIDYLRKWRLALEAGADPTLLPGGQFHLTDMSAEAVANILGISAPFIDLKLRDTHGRSLLLATALHTTNNDQSQLLRLLLRAGAEVSDQDLEGNCCLHLLLQAMQPHQTHCLDSLTILLGAGANVFLRNDDGQSTMDIATASSPELGSYRQDVLLCALVRSGCRVTDQRLFRSPTLTQRYTSGQYALLRHGSNDLHETRNDLRSRLLKKLIGCVDCSSVFSKYSLHETAVDRVLSMCDGCVDEADASALFSTVLRYLRLMIEGKKQIVHMTKDRLPYQTWSPYGQDLDWLKLTDEAETAALVEFDWFRSVDYEDLFITRADTLIQQLEDWKLQHGPSNNIDRLQGIIENTLPSHREMREREDGQRHADASTLHIEHRVGRLSGIRTSNLPKHEACRQDILDSRRDSMSPEQRPRHCSILETPSEYYPPTCDLDERLVQDLQWDPRDTWLCLSAGNVAQGCRKGMALVH